MYRLGCGDDGKTGPGLCDWIGEGRVDAKEGEDNSADNLRLVEPRHLVENNLQIPVEARTGQELDFRGSTVLLDNRSLETVVFFVEVRKRGH